MKAAKSIRKRDAEATAERILSAAQQVFHEKGYDQATTREIADRADVNLALIKRYFGSKLGLFEKAVLPHLSLERFLTLPAEDLAEVMAATYANTEAMAGFDPFVALVRSIASPEAGPLLAETLQRQALTPLANVLEGEEASARATLIATQLAGLILQFRILGMTPRTEAEREAIRLRLARYLDSLIRESVREP